jgi:hypothetical protein
MRVDPPDPRLDRQLDAWAERGPRPELRAEIGQRIQQMLAPSLKPVRPLPARGWLTLGFVGVFAASALGLTAVMAGPGLDRMTGTQIAGMTAVLVLGAILFSITLVWRMIPGSRELLTLGVVLTLAGLGITGTVALLFPWRHLGALPSQGMPCAVMEVSIAIPALAAFWLLARRGVLFPGAGLGAALGGLAGLLAIAVQQFQCMFQNAPHLLIWHVGLAVLLTAASALIGATVRRSSKS